MSPEDFRSWDAPPPYQLESSGAVLTTSSTLNAAGCVDINFSSSAPEELTKSITLPPISAIQRRPVPLTQCPPLNIVIQVVGSRGDVQPFIALGVALQRYGHRVRLATHDVFESFVMKSGLEFYPIGGDPEDLMSYMVRNPGLLPSLDSLRGGDIPRKRRMIFEILQGCWSSCICPDPMTSESFVANAIIANPPSFAHVHCAQALGIPAHMMFTMPWTATRAFPHPLTNVKAHNTSESIANYLSYGVVDLMTWQGLGDVINGWRMRDLRLDPIPASMGPDLINILKVSYTYCWSPALVSKPQDWGPNIDICGFFMREPPLYTPDEDLARFLQAGPVPIYIGFGSIVLENAREMTNIILDACRAAKVRVIVSKGWSKLGGTDSSSNDVLYLGDCPHEWLFERVSVVIHHGGAGTTACGLYNARPTVIIPFFGDQPFWGKVVANNGAGPAPIPHKLLNSQNLADGIRFCLEAKTQNSAQVVADKMRLENGVDMAVQSFHRNLVVSDVACDILPQHAADWSYTLPESQRVIKLSHAALKILVIEKQVKLTDVLPFRSREYHTDHIRWEPMTAGAASMLGVLTDFTSALGGTFVDPYKEYRQARRSGGDGGAASRAAASAAGKGFASIGTSLTKGTLVDVPLALTEGLRNVPKLYGDDVGNHEKVKDWKSGGVVAAKNFGTGFYEGVTDIVTKPYAGAKKEGTMGFMKGVGKGSLNLVTKPGSAMFGLLAYPAQGIYKSIKNLGRDKITDKIIESKLESLERSNEQDVDMPTTKVVAAFSSRLEKSR